MSIKKNFLVSILFLFTSLGFTFAGANIFIKLKVNDFIITNIDIKKEAAYLEILNPKISELDNSQILNLAENSVVNEIIKKDEINKFFVLEDKDFIDEKLLIDLIKKLNLTESEFQSLLIQKKSYTLDEVRKKLKVEILWNDLIYYRFNKQIKIDKDSITKKIDEIKSNEKKQYLLSEIIFEKKQDQTLENYANKIKESIKEIGFSNTANIFSIADSSKFGGKIGWVDENSLSKIINEKLRFLDKGQFTNEIQIGNNYLMLMIDEIRIIKETIDKKIELNKLIKFETNRQLNQFSKIYLNKVSANYKINEK